MNTLHLYQWHAIQDIVKYLQAGERRIALVMPTGAGKTVTIAFLLMKVKGAFKSAIVATPLVSIEEGFRATKGVWKAPTQEIEGSATRAAWDLTKLFYGSDNKILRADRDAWRTYLTADRVNQFALVRTHSAVRSWSDDLPDDLTGRIFVIDEAHHADNDETNLGDIADLWYQRGGTVIYMTATPFTKNGVSSLPEGTARHERSIAKHAKFLEMDFHIERTGVSGTSGTWKALAGIDLPKNASLLADGLVARWIADGAPKAVMIVPPNRSVKWSNYLADALAAARPGTRVVNAVGLEKSTKDLLKEALKSERDVRNFEDSQVDVAIACRRFDEGTDWPLCSHVYNVGMPMNFGLAIQRWGRAFRDKRQIAGYPKNHCSKSHIVFVVPKVNAKDALEFEKKSHNAALLLACYAENFEVARQYVAVAESEPNSLEELRERQPIPIEILLQAQEILVGEKERGYAAWQTFVNEHEDPMLRRALRHELGTQVRKSRAGGYRDRSPKLAAGMEAYFDQVAAEFGDKTTLAVFAESIQAVTAMTGETAGELTERLKGKERGTLAELYPELAAQWHPILNGSLTPDQVLVTMMKQE